MAAACAALCLAADADFFKAADANQDGYITRDELRGAMTQWLRARASGPKGIGQRAERGVSGIDVYGNDLAATKPDAEAGRSEKDGSSATGVGARETDEVAEGVGTV